ncbi:MAG: hypothetical protein AB7G47_18835 [Mycolicibacterium sp.]|uniref:hypothetical protein n=1 Tax=Mycolicibacterium sp. TaxID=2320850 RepID=UPI003D125EE3
MGDTLTHTRGGRLRIPRSRGATSGFLIMVLGLWGALVPFVGPYFDFAFSPDRPWVWTAGRGWLEVLPGVVAVLGGLMMVVSRNRATAMFGTWIAVLAGAWFVMGRALAGPLGLGDVGTPVAVTGVKQSWLELSFFYGPGALIVFFGALALGRLSVRTARDIAFADTHGEEVAAPARAEPTAGEPTVSDTHDGSGDKLAAGRAEVLGSAEQAPDEQRAPTARHRWTSVFRRGGHRADRKIHV